jgi:hypothetical protein
MGDSVGIDATNYRRVVSFGAPEVKKISDGDAWSSSATFFRAFSIADLTSRPWLWTEEGLP